MINNLTKIFNKCANDIPGWMSKQDLLTLFFIFKKYNHENTVGVEIGSLHGKSSTMIANTIEKGILYCIDIWPENADPDSSLELFLEYTKLTTNIKPIRGHSPDIVENWNEPVDFVFLDALHLNPDDRTNIDFWLPKIKKMELLPDTIIQKTFLTL